MNDKTQSKGERAVFWIGSIAGIMIAIFTIYDRVLEPSPAYLSVLFNETQSTNLLITPSGSVSQGYTEEIPIFLKIENRGGKASANTKLRLTYRPTTAISIKGSSEAISVLGKKNENFQQQSITIENVNPGEIFLLPVFIRFDITRLREKAVGNNIYSKDQSPLKLGYTVFADISSDATPSKRVILNFTLGECDVLAREGPVFWMGHNDSEKGVKLIQVQDDFPCND